MLKPTYPQKDMASSSHTCCSEHKRGKQEDIVAPADLRSVTAHTHTVQAERSHFHLDMIRSLGRVEESRSLYHHG